MVSYVKNYFVGVIGMHITIDEDCSTQVALAKNPNISTEKMEELSKHFNMSVRTALAGNPNTSSKILKKLSKDKERYVRIAVAQNPNTSLRIIKKLLKDSDNDVKKTCNARLQKK